MKFYCGLDLGQAADFTALSVLERIPTTPKPSYQLRFLERAPLKTPYPQIVADVKALLNQSPLKGETKLILDQTGVGRPVYDLFAQAGLNPVGVTITGGGDAIHAASNQWRVSKRDLVATAKVLLQTGRLKVAEGLPLASVFVSELMAFRVKVSAATGHENYESWRENTHDDLVLSVCLACWFAEKGPGLPFAHIPDSAVTGLVESVRWPDGSITRHGRG